ncbi:MAG: hypothetical protein ACE5IY_03245 [bacterium]
MSLLRELQEITERTYQKASGINLENFIIGKQRFFDLSSLCAPAAAELSEIARVFYRKAGEGLYLAVYFSEQLISLLETHDPRKGLHEKNIYPFLVFIEEINHCVHAALKFVSGDRAVNTEEFIRDLELLAKIDSYQMLKFFLAYFNPSNKLENFDRLWIKHHLFERPNFEYDNRTLRVRYEETNRLGEKYTRFLDGMEAESRLEEMRRFRAMRYGVKARYIAMLP